MVLLSGLPNVASLLQMRKPLDQKFCDVSGFALNFNNRLNSFITTCICMVRYADFLNLEVNEQYLFRILRLSTQFVN